MEVDVTIERSDHPDDDRLTDPVTCRIEVDVLPREGETLELPWPLDANTDRRATARVEMVEHVWHRLVRDDADGQVLLLHPRLVAKLWDIDIDEGW